MISWLIQSLIASAMLMAIVLMLRGPVSRAFGATIGYALWLLPAVRMILPPIPGWHVLYVPVFHIQRGHSTVGIVDPATAMKLAHQPSFDLAAHVAAHVEAVHAEIAPRTEIVIHGGPIDWLAVILAIWLGGAILWFGWQMLRYRLFLARAMADAVPLSRECGIDVLISDHVGGPVAAGIFRRRIFLPVDFLTRYSSEERRLALKHEAAHHDRLDIPANLAGLALVALHWWNPLAHRAYRAFRADQELACDATVLADAHPTERLTYGSAMLKSASGRTPVAACALGHKDQLKQRIRMMTKGPIGATRLIIGGMLTIAAIGGGLVATASGSATAPNETVAPVPPVPPVPPIPGVAPVAPSAPPVFAAPAPPAPPAPPARIPAEARRHVEAAERHAAAAQKQAEVAEQEAVASMDIEGQVRRSMDSAHAGLAAQCAREGVTMPNDADWNALATCGKHLHDTIRASLASARAAIDANRALSEEQRDQARAGLDKAMADLDREMAEAARKS